MDSQLVTVIVATYNSAQFVLETLESVRGQTYINIELIVSDDGSTDDTVQVVNNWLNSDQNRDRFVRAEMITVPINTGISANCNRAIAAARAAWIKLIAGDDILLPYCIEDNMKFVTNKDDAKIVFSRVRNFKDTFDQSNYIDTQPEEFPMNIMAPDLSTQDQLKLLLVSDRIKFSPSYFFFKEAVISVGGYDERNRLVEDYPMWLKLSRAGYKFHFMDLPTVGYRQHVNATNNRGNNTLFKPAFLKLQEFRRKHVYPSLPLDLVGAEKFKAIVSRGFEALRLNQNTVTLRFIYTLLTVYLNPFIYVILFKRRVLRMGTRNIFYR